MRRVEPRTIPTRVGRTAVHRAAGHRGPDHPHAGGENNRIAQGRFSLFGPSPRGWGELSSKRKCRLKLRTIPTRVGRTCARMVLENSPADHPHAGGENSMSSVCSGTINGPSPRGWGERPLYGPPNHSGRTIPTRVGRTAPREGIAMTLADHPHAGGENQEVDAAHAASVGPSPRGWGELGVHLRHCSGFRTIPTRVGRTREPKR